MNAPFGAFEHPVVVAGGQVLTERGLERLDLVVHQGIVVELGASVDHPAGATVLDASGALVGPSFVDLHTHLREPGREQAETIETGTRAAALGGYGAVVAMPNTEPTMDTAAVVHMVLERGRNAPCEVAAAGAITVGRLGAQLAPMAELAALGVELFTDDGTGVQDGGVARRAMDYCRGLGVTYAEHCEDLAIAHGGCVHEGAWSALLGLPGQPAAAEEAMVARDLLLAATTGARLHLLHLSTAGSVELVRQAKARGVAVTAEVAPHHLSLTDASLKGYDPCFKVNPPLRPAEHLEALLDGLNDGTIDAVATDHAPHTPELKDLPFDQAPPGMLGLETAASITYEQLVAGRGATIERFFEVMATQPAKIARLDGTGARPFGHSVHGQRVAVGTTANLVVFDPEVRWTLEVDQLASKATNSPFSGARLVGKVRHCLLRGEPVVTDARSTR